MPPSESNARSSSTALLVCSSTAFCAKNRRRSSSGRSTRALKMSSTSFVTATSFHQLSMVGCSRGADRRKESCARVESSTAASLPVIMPPAARPICAFAMSCAFGGCADFNCAISFVAASTAAPPSPAPSAASRSANGGPPKDRFAWWNSKIESDQHRTPRSTLQT